MSFDLNSLNPQQREAVETIQGPLLLLAGAGTGKTMVITCRIAHMVKSGIPASSIMAVTFTNKAANEMRERVGGLIPQSQAKQVTVSTFHSFCLKILHRFARRLDYSNDFSLADFGDQKGIIRQAMGKLSYGEDVGMDEQAYLSKISLAKNKNISYQDLIASENTIDQKIGYVYEFYQNYLHAINVMDFDDLLMLTVKLFNEHPDVLQHYRDQFKFMLVDEFQDTNFVQMEIIRLIGGNRPNLCVVGDDDQSIYSWRGAEVQNILDFPKQFQGTKVIKLEQNYRSTNHILNAANKVISINAARHEKNLWSGSGDGEKVKVIALDKANSEGEMLVDVIRDKVARGECKYKDIAVLYRSNMQTRIIENHFRYKKVPYRLVGDSSFYERREIRDAIAFLTAAFNPQNDMCLLRILDVPPRGIGSSTIMKIRQEAENTQRNVDAILADEIFRKRLTPSVANAVGDFYETLKVHRRNLQEPGDMLRKVEDYLREVGYLDGLGRMYKPREDAEIRYENVYELIHSIGEMEKKHTDGPFYLKTFLDTVSLTEEFNRKKKEEDAVNSVSLMTVHASKGLEFPYVFLIGVEDKMFPHERSMRDAALAEERRLFYVAVTRAKKELVISWAKTRLMRKELKRRRASQFIHELPQEHIEHLEREDLLKKVTVEDSQAMMADFLKSLG